MEHEVDSYLGLNEIGKPSSIIIFIIISYLFNHTFQDLSLRVFRIYLFGFLRFICYDFWDLSVMIFFWYL